MSSREPVRPAYFQVPALPVEREELDPAAPGLWGSVDLELEVAADSWLHVGSGAPKPAGRALAAAHTWAPVVRDRRWVNVPVVPGTSIKGAVRAVFEALTPSCEVFDRGACRVGRPPIQLCPACAVFGAAGLRGRVGFDEARATTYEVQVIEVPQRYSHQHAPRQGRRLYTPGTEHPEPATRELLECLSGGSRLSTRLTTSGAPGWALGLITIVLGLGPWGLPHLRLGGGKNRGMGIVTVQITGGRVAASRADLIVRRTGPVDEEAVAGWQEAARERFPALEDQRTAIAQGYGAGR